jgi:hypothetical protein
LLSLLVAPEQFVTIAQSEPVALENPQLTTGKRISQVEAEQSILIRIPERLRFIRARIRPVTVGAFVLGTTVSVLGAAWAIWLGVAYPIAIMAGYCTLVATICAAFLLSMLPKHETKREERLVSTRPSVSEAWKHVNTFSVSDAARLWCEVEPGATVTQDIIAWGRLLLDAISNGELACVRNEAQSGRPVSYPSDKPHWSTEVTRDALQAWARKRGFEPGFLQDQ